MPPGRSSAMTLKRIQRELADLQKEDLGDMVLQPSESNLHIWTARIPGPAGSLYEGGVFELELLLPADYPFSAPRVAFKTRIYHMNISEHGAICIDILKGQWSPALSLFKVMLSLSSLLTDPNPKDPLVPSIAQQYLRSRKQHDETARQWVKTFALPKPPPPPPAAPEKTEKTNGKGKTRASGASTSGSGFAAASGSASTSTAAATAAAHTTATTASRRSTRSSALAHGSNSNATDDVIVVSDSENEAGAERPALKQHLPPKKRKRGSDVVVGSAPGAEVLEVEDSEDEVEAPPKRTRSTRVVAAGAADSASGSSRAGSSRDEIIVLD